MSYFGYPTPKGAPASPTKRPTTLDWEHLDKASEEKSGDKADGRVARVEAEESEADDRAEIVEMCSAWAMIPFTEAFSSSAKKFKIKMYGGTPFSTQKITKKDVQKRPGMFNAFKRLMGIKVFTSFY
jgi:hypothetical protein